MGVEEEEHRISDASLVPRQISLIPMDFWCGRGRKGSNGPQAAYLAGALTLPPTSRAHVVLKNSRNCQDSVWVGGLLRASLPVLS